MVERTNYTDAAHTPAISLRQIFGRLGLKETLCKAAADAGFLKVEFVAMLGDTSATVKANIRTLIEEAKLGANAAEIELSLMQLSAVWQACSALQNQFASRRARMEEDPNKIPEMAQEDHAEFRSRFVTAHPDVILLDGKEPHKKFVEKLSRDFLIHGMVPFYQGSETRTRADSIVQKSGPSKNAEDLLTITKADEPDQVTDVQTLMNRIHALFMALEYLNICNYSKTAGTLKYLQELEQFRSDCPGLPNLMTADSLIRKKVNRLQAEQRQTYPTFSDALLEVLNNHKYLWNDARTKAVLQKVDKKKEDLEPTTDQVVDSTVHREGRPMIARSARELRTRSSSVRPRRPDLFRSLISRNPKEEASRTRSTRTRGSQTQSGRLSHLPPPRSRVRRDATISTPPWVAGSVTSAGSNISAWSAGQGIPWSAIIENLWSDRSQWESG